MTALRVSLISLFCAVSMSACMKSPTLAFYNGTSDDLQVRVEVDSWFSVRNCNSGQTLTSMNQQGGFALPAGQFVCMSAKARKDELPAAELISRVAVVRDGQRCLTANRDQLRDATERAGGYQALRITDDVCPDGAPAPAPAPEAAPEAGAEQ